MAARVNLRADLDTLVADRFLRPHVQRVRDDILAEARRRAPDARTWSTSRDDRVRPAHVAADGQTIPGNLRFRVPRPGGDVSGFQWYAVGGDVELARAPRDPDLSIGNRARCRCSAVSVPGAVARSIRSGPVTVQGPRVAAVVETRFPRVVESEFPGTGDTGGGWMRAAVNEVAARSVSAAARGT